MATFKAFQHICLSPDPKAEVSKIIRPQTLELELWVALLLPQYHFKKFALPEVLIKATAEALGYPEDALLVDFDRKALMHHLVIEAFRKNISLIPLQSTLTLKEVMTFVQALEHPDPSLLVENLKSLLPRCTEQDVIFLINIWQKDLEIGYDIIQTICECLHPQAYAAFQQYPDLVTIARKVQESKDGQVNFTPSIKPGQACRPFELLDVSSQDYTPDFNNSMFMSEGVGEHLQLHILEDELLAFDDERKPVDIPRRIIRHKEKWMQWVRSFDQATSSSDSGPRGVVMDLLVDQKSIKLWDILYWKRQCVTEYPFQERWKLMRVVPDLPHVSLPITYNPKTPTEWMALSQERQVTVRHNSSLYEPHAAYRVEKYVQKITPDLDASNIIARQPRASAQVALDYMAQLSWSSPYEQALVSLSGSGSTPGASVGFEPDEVGKFVELKDQPCLICCETVVKEDQVFLPCIRTNKCVAAMHENCFRSWMKFNNVCPHCKTKVKTFWGADHVDSDQKMKPAQINTVSYLDEETMRRNDQEVEELLRFMIQDSRKFREEQAQKAKTELKLTLNEKKKTTTLKKRDSFALLPSLPDSQRTELRFSDTSPVVDGLCGKRKKQNSRPSQPLSVLKKKKSDFSTASSGSKAKKELRFVLPQEKKKYNPFPGTLKVSLTDLGIAKKTGASVSSFLHGQLDSSSLMNNLHGTPHRPKNALRGKGRAALDHSSLSQMEAQMNKIRQQFQEQQARAVQRIQKEMKRIVMKKSLESALTDPTFQSWK